MEVSCLYNFLCVLLLKITFRSVVNLTISILSNRTAVELKPRVVP